MFYVAVTTLLLITVSIMVSMNFSMNWIFWVTCLGQVLILIMVYRVLTDKYATDKTFKDFYEEFAKDKGIKTVINYCPDDNFRMISLNEGHDYEKTGNTLKNTTNMIEWVKKLK